MTQGTNTIRSACCSGRRQARFTDGVLFPLPRSFLSSNCSGELSRERWILDGKTGGAGVSCLTRSPVVSTPRRVPASLCYLPRSKEALSLLEAASRSLRSDDGGGHSTQRWTLVLSRAWWGLARQMDAEQWRQARQRWMRPKRAGVARPKI